MFKTKTVLSQMQALIYGYDFKKVVSDHNGDKGVRSFFTIDLLKVMLYMHMASKQSLRDIVISLKSKKNLWYHLGLKSISRNNLSYALKQRPYEIFEKTFYTLLGRLQKERGTMKDKRFRFKMPVKIIDSTTVGLCLSLFNWAKFRTTKGGIKLHVMLDAKEQLPDFVLFSNAKHHDVKAAWGMPIKKDSMYVMDKGYMCFKLLEKINKNRAFFVIRTKTNTQFKILERRKKFNSSIKADWRVQFCSYKSKDYPGELRIVRFYDKEKKKTYEYMTNNFELSARTIADIYKSRWDIELFFKWIKQNLKIKTFIGTSRNAVLIQIWTAMIAYLITEYIRFKSRTAFSLLQTFRILSDNIMHHYDIYQLIEDDPPMRINGNEFQNLQLSFGF